MNKLGSTDIFKLKSKEVKENYKFAHLPTEDYWKFGFIEELTDLRLDILVLDTDEAEDDDEIRFKKIEIE